MKKIAIVLIAVLLLFAVFSLTACDAVKDLAENLEQSIDGAANGGEQGGNGNGGEPGGNGNGGGSMTKEAFFAELERRETATFADNDLRYATLEARLVLDQGEEDYDGTYEATCDLTYGIDQYDERHAYVTVPTGQNGHSRGQQQQVLGMTSRMRSNIEYMPEEVRAETSFSAEGEDIVLELDTEYMGMPIYEKYVFNGKGFLIYRNERGFENGREMSIEFTVLAFNREKELTKETFLTKLEAAERLSYDRERYYYDTATLTLVKSGAGDIDGTYSGTYDLDYALDGQGKGHAFFEVQANEVSTLSLEVLGLSKKVTRIFNYGSDDAFDIKRVGSDLVAKAEFTQAGVRMKVHYVFDNEGYVRYYLQQQDTLREELTVTAYAKAPAAENAE